MKELIIKEKMNDVFVDIAKEKLHLNLPLIVISMHGQVMPYMTKLQDARDELPSEFMIPAIKGALGIFIKESGTSLDDIDFIAIGRNTFREGDTFGDELQAKFEEGDRNVCESIVCEVYSRNSKPVFYSSDIRSTITGEVEIDPERERKASAFDLSFDVLVSVLNLKDVRDLHGELCMDREMLLGIMMYQHTQESINPMILDLIDSKDGMDIPEEIISKEDLAELRNELRLKSMSMKDIFRFELDK